MLAVKEQIPKQDFLPFIKKEIVYDFSLINENVAFSVLRDYLIDDNIFLRKQRNANRIQAKRLDLNYQLIYVAEKMYKVINNTGDLAPEFVGRRRVGKIHAKSILKDTVMNEHFEDYISKSGPARIFISRDRIVKALNALNEPHRAVIYYFILVKKNNLSINFFGRGYKKYQEGYKRKRDGKQIKGFKNMSWNGLNEKLTNAINALIRAVNLQVELRQ